MDLWRGRLSLRRAAVLTAQLPGGARVWQETGGARAWSDTVATLMVLELRLREQMWAQTEEAEKGKNRPEIQKYPPFEGDEEVKASKADSKAEIFMRRQREREQRQEVANERRRNAISGAHPNNQGVRKEPRA